MIYVQQLRDIIFTKKNLWIRLSRKSLLLINVLINNSLLKKHDNNHLKHSNSMINIIC